MKKILSISAATLLVFAFTFNDDLTASIINKFNQYTELNPQEKAYLHLDKPYYTAGETIWLKAYVVEANTNLPDTISVPLYVELIDNQMGRVL